MTGEFLTPVRSFNDLGIAAVRRLLERMRKEGKFLPDAIELLLADPTYTELVPDVAPINRTLEFKTKLELVNYFKEIIPESVVDRLRCDVGVWTWLAVAYSTQLIKHTRKGLSLGADECWIFNCEYRLGRRHYIAGAVYLYRDLSGLGEEVVDLLFSSPVNEFGGFIDAATYKQEGYRIPAVLQVAIWLYYDPKSPKKIKRGSTSQDKPGAFRQLLRVVAQFARTMEFYDKRDAELLWKKLPSQFDRFKIGVTH